MTLIELLKELELSVKDNREYSEAERNNRNEYLTFILNNEVYAISAYCMEEVIQLNEYISISEGHDYNKGLIRYKDGLLEIIDLRLRLKIKPKEYDFFTTVIVVKINNELFGLIVDDVIKITALPISKYSAEQKTNNLIKETIKDKNMEIKILDVGNIFNFDQFHLMSFGVI